jgi:hypothetical protein
MEPKPQIKDAAEPRTAAGKAAFEAAKARAEKTVAHT